MDGPIALTIAEVQRVLSVKTPETVVRLIKDRKLAAFKVGRQWRIRPAALAEYQSASEQAVAAQPDTHRQTNVIEMRDRLETAKQKGAR